MKIDINKRIHPYDGLSYKSKLAVKGMEEGKASRNCDQVFIGSDASLA